MIGFDKVVVAGRDNGRAFFIHRRLGMAIAHLFTVTVGKLSRIPTLRFEKNASYILEPLPRESQLSAEEAKVSMIKHEQELNQFVRFLGKIILHQTRTDGYVTRPSARSRAFYRRPVCLIVRAFQWRP